MYMYRAWRTSWQVMRDRRRRSSCQAKIGHELRELTRIKRSQKHYHSVTEPQPKTKTHHGGTETRRRSKPIHQRGHEGTQRKSKSESAQSNGSNARSNLHVRSQIYFPCKITSYGH